MAMNNSTSRRTYPSPANAHRDPQLARLTYPALADELSSFSDFLYFSIILEDIMPDVSALLEEIALDELEHYRMLSELIRSLGGNPAINTRLRTPLADISSDDDIAAINSLPDILRPLIAGEDQATAMYAELVEYAGDNPAAAIFSRFSSDEADHARWLRQIVVK